MSDTEHAVQHIDRALYSRRDLRLLRPGRRLSRGRLPPHLDQPLRLLEALELVEPPVDVVDRLDPAGDVARRLRDEDLTRARRRTDAGSQVHRPPEEVAAFLDRLAGVDADADGDPGPRLVPIRLAQGQLDRDRADDRAFRGREGDHEAVALGLHDLAAERLDLLADDRVVLLENLERGLVAVLVGVLREAPDVAEEEGDGGVELPRHRGGGLGRVRLLVSAAAWLHVALRA